MHFLSDAPSSWTSLLSSVRRGTHKYFLSIFQLTMDPDPENPYTHTLTRNNASLVPTRLLQLPGDYPPVTRVACTLILSLSSLPLPPSTTAISTH